MSNKEYIFKSPSTQKYIFLILGCLTFPVQNDLCAQFDTWRLFSHESAESFAALILYLSLRSVHMSRLLW